MHRTQSKKTKRKNKRFSDTYFFFSFFLSIQVLRFEQLPRQQFVATVNFTMLGGLD